MPDIDSYNKRLTALRSERSSFMDLWRELSDYHLSYRGRFLTSNRNRGYKRNTKQINNSSYLASRTLAAGMMSGITSPARPWFRLNAGDAEVNDRVAVRQWLFDVERIMYTVFSQSNTYNSLHQLYAELGVFGTGAMGVYQDFDNVIRCQTYTVGSYALGMNGRSEIDTFYREYELPVGSIVKQFGYGNVSNRIREQWNSGNTEQWVKLVHVVEPNDDRDNQSPLATDMPVRSVYYEYGSAESQGGQQPDKSMFLRMSGFEEMPILTPRWDLTTEDIYATSCPGISALGDTKALQLGEKRAYQALDKVANPPLQAPSTLRTKLSGNNLNSNEIVWTTDATQQISSIYGNWRPDLSAMSAYNDKVERRIRSTFYEDLFLALIGDAGSQPITAREVTERHEEKLLMLGPVLERLHSELLDPLIDRTFNILQRNGVFPPPPSELEGTDLNVQYVSVLAQAQQMVSTGGIERLSGFAGNLSGLWPEAGDKVNASQLVDDYAQALGVNPRAIRSDEDVAALAQQRQQAQAQAAAIQQGEQLAKTAKAASDVDLDGDNLVSAAVETLGGGQ